MASHGFGWLLVQLRSCLAAEKQGRLVSVDAGIVDRVRAALKFSTEPSSPAAFQLQARCALPEAPRPSEVTASPPGAAAKLFPDHAPFEPARWPRVVALLSDVSRALGADNNEVWKAFALAGLTPPPRTEDEEDASALTPAFLFEVCRTVMEERLARWQLLHLLFSSFEHGPEHPVLDDFNKDDDEDSSLHSLVMEKAFLLLSKRDLLPSMVGSFQALRTVRAPFFLRSDVEQCCSLWSESDESVRSSRRECQGPLEQLFARNLLEQQLEILSTIACIANSVVECVSCSTAEVVSLWSVPPRPSEEGKHLSHVLIDGLFRLLEAIGMNDAWRTACKGSAPGSMSLPVFDAPEQQVAFLRAIGVPFVERVFYAYPFLLVGSIHSLVQHERLFFLDATMEGPWRAPPLLLGAIAPSKIDPAFTSCIANVWARFDSLVQCYDTFLQHGTDPTAALPPVVLLAMRYASFVLTFRDTTAHAPASPDWIARFRSCEQCLFSPSEALDSRVLRSAAASLSIGLSTASLADATDADTQHACRELSTVHSQAWHSIAHPRLVGSLEASRGLAGSRGDEDSESEEEDDADDAEYNAEEAWTAHPNDGSALLAPEHYIARDQWESPALGVLRNTFHSDIIQDTEPSLSAGRSAMAFLINSLIVGTVEDSLECRRKCVARIGAPIARSVASASALVECVRVAWSACRGQGRALTSLRNVAWVDQLRGGHRYDEMKAVQATLAQQDVASVGSLLGLARDQYPLNPSLLPELASAIADSPGTSKCVYSALCSAPRMTVAVSPKWLACWSRASPSMHMMQLTNSLFLPSQGVTVPSGAQFILAHGGSSDGAPFEALQAQAREFDVVGWASSKKARWSSASFGSSSSAGSADSHERMEWGGAPEPEPSNPHVLPSVVTLEMGSTSLWVPMLGRLASASLRSTERYGASSLGARGTVEVSSIASLLASLFRPCPALLQELGDHLARQCGAERVVIGGTAGEAIARAREDEERAGASALATVRRRRITLEWIARHLSNLCLSLASMVLDANQGLHVASTAERSQGVAPELLAAAWTLSGAQSGFETITEEQIRLAGDRKSLAVACSEAAHLGREALTACISALAVIIRAAPREVLTVLTEAHPVPSTSILHTGSQRGESASDRVPVIEAIEELLRQVEGSDGNYPVTLATSNLASAVVNGVIRRRSLLDMREALTSLGASAKISVDASATSLPVVAVRKALGNSGLLRGMSEDIAAAMAKLLDVDGSGTVELDELARLAQGDAVVAVLTCSMALSSAKALSAQRAVLATTPGSAKSFVQEHLRAAAEGAISAAGGDVSAAIRAARLLRDAIRAVAGRSSAVFEAENTLLRSAATFATRVLCAHSRATFKRSVEKYVLVSRCCRTLRLLLSDKTSAAEIAQRRVEASLMGETLAPAHTRSVRDEVLRWMLRSVQFRSALVSTATELSVSAMRVRPHSRRSQRSALEADVRGKRGKGLSDALQRQVDELYEQAAPVHSGEPKEVLRAACGGAVSAEAAERGALDAEEWLLCDLERHGVLPTFSHTEFGKRILAMATRRSVRLLGDILSSSPLDVQNPLEELMGTSNSSSVHARDTVRLLWAQVEEMVFSRGMSHDALMSRLTPLVASMAPTVTPSHIPESHSAGTAGQVSLAMSQHASAAGLGGGGFGAVAAVACSGDLSHSLRWDAGSKAALLATSIHIPTVEDIWLTSTSASAAAVSRGAQFSWLASLPSHSGRLGSVLSSQEVQSGGYESFGTSQGSSNGGMSSRGLAGKSEGAHTTTALVCLAQLLRFKGDGLRSGRQDTVASSAARLLLLHTRCVQAAETSERDMVTASKEAYRLITDTLESLPTDPITPEVSSVVTGPHKSLVWKTLSVPQRQAVARMASLRARDGRVALIAFTAAQLDDITPLVHQSLARGVRSGGGVLSQLFGWAAHLRQTLFQHAGHTWMGSYLAHPRGSGYGTSLVQTDPEHANLFALPPGPFVPPESCAPDPDESFASVQQAIGDLARVAHTSGGSFGAFLLNVGAPTEVESSAKRLYFEDEAAPVASKPEIKGLAAFVAASGIGLSSSLHSTVGTVLRWHPSWLFQPRRLVQALSSLLQLWMAAYSSDTQRGGASSHPNLVDPFTAPISSGSRQSHIVAAVTTVRDIPGIWRAVGSVIRQRSPVFPPFIPTRSGNEERTRMHIDQRCDREFGWQVDDAASDLPTDALAGTAIRTTANASLPHPPSDTSPSLFERADGFSPSAVSQWCHRVAARALAMRLLTVEMLATAAHGLHPGVLEQFEPSLVPLQAPSGQDDNPGALSGNSTWLDPPQLPPNGECLLHPGSHSEQARLSHLVQHHQRVSDHVGGAFPSRVLAAREMRVALIEAHRSSQDSTQHMFSRGLSRAVDIAEGLGVLDGVTHNESAGVRQAKKLDSLREQLSMQDPRHQQPAVASGPGAGGSGVMSTWLWLCRTAPVLSIGSSLDAELREAAAAAGVSVAPFVRPRDSGNAESSTLDDMASVVSGPAWNAQRLSSWSAAAVAADRIDSSSSPSGFGPGTDVDCRASLYGESFVIGTRMIADRLGLTRAWEHSRRLRSLAYGDDVRDAERHGLVLRELHQLEEEGHPEFLRNPSKSLPPLFDSSAPTWRSEYLSLAAKTDSESSSYSAARAGLRLLWTASAWNCAASVLDAQLLQLRAWSGFLGATLGRITVLKRLPISAYLPADSKVRGPAYTAAMSVIAQLQAARPRDVASTQATLALAEASVSAIQATLNASRMSVEHVSRKGTGLDPWSLVQLLLNQALATCRLCEKISELVEPAHVLRDSLGPVEVVAAARAGSSALFLAQLCTQLRKTLLLGCSLLLSRLKTRMDHADVVNTSSEEQESKSSKEQEDSWRSISLDEAVKIAEMEDHSAMELHQELASFVGVEGEASTPPPSPGQTTRVGHVTGIANLTVINRSLEQAATSSTTYTLETIRHLRKWLRLVTLRLLPHAAHSLRIALDSASKPAVPAELVDWAEHHVFRPVVTSAATSAAASPSPPESLLVGVSSPTTQSERDLLDVSLSLVTLLCDTRWAPPGDFIPSLSIQGVLPAAVACALSLSSQLASVFAAYTAWWAKVVREQRLTRDSALTGTDSLSIEPEHAWDLLLSTERFLSRKPRDARRSRSDLPRSTLRGGEHDPLAVSPAETALCLVRNQPLAMDPATSSWARAASSVVHGCISLLSSVASVNTAFAPALVLRSGVSALLNENALFRWMESVIALRRKAGAAGEPSRPGRVGRAVVPPGVFAVRWRGAGWGLGPALHRGHDLDRDATESNTHLAWCDAIQLASLLARHAVQHADSIHRAIEERRRMLAVLRARAKERGLDPEVVVAKYAASLARAESAEPLASGTRELERLLQNAQHLSKSPALVAGLVTNLNHEDMAAASETIVEQVNSDVSTAEMARALSAMASRPLSELATMARAASHEGADIAAVGAIQGLVSSEAPPSPQPASTTTATAAALHPPHWSRGFSSNGMIDSALAASQSGLSVSNIGGDPGALASSTVGPSSWAATGLRDTAVSAGGVDFAVRAEARSKEARQRSQAVRNLTGKEWWIVMADTTMDASITLLSEFLENYENTITTALTSRTMTVQSLRETRVVAECLRVAFAPKIRDVWLQRQLQNTLSRAQFLARHRGSGLENGGGDSRAETVLTTCLSRMAAALTLSVRDMALLLGSGDTVEASGRTHWDASHSSYTIVPPGGLTVVPPTTHGSTAVQLSEAASAHSGQVQRRSLLESTGVGIYPASSVEHVQAVKVPVALNKANKIRRQMALRNAVGVLATSLDKAPHARLERQFQVFQEMTGGGAPPSAAVSKAVARLKSLSRRPSHDADEPASPARVGARMTPLMSPMEPLKVPEEPAELVLDMEPDARSVDGEQPADLIIDEFDVKAELALLPVVAVLLEACVAASRPNESDARSAAEQAASVRAARKLQAKKEEPSSSPASRSPRPSHGRSGSDSHVRPSQSLRSPSSEVYRSQMGRSGSRGRSFARGDIRASLARSASRSRSPSTSGRRRSVGGDSDASRVSSNDQSAEDSFGSARLAGSIAAKYSLPSKPLVDRTSLGPAYLASLVAARLRGVRVSFASSQDTESDVCDTFLTLSAIGLRPVGTGEDPTFQENSLRERHARAKALLQDLDDDDMSQTSSRVEVALALLAAEKAPFADESEVLFRSVQCVPMRKATEGSASEWLGREPGMGHLLHLLSFALGGIHGLVEEEDLVAPRTPIVLDKGVASPGRGNRAGISVISAARSLRGLGGSTMAGGATVKRTEEESVALGKTLLRRILRAGVMLVTRGVDYTCRRDDLQTDVAKDLRHDISTVVGDAWFGADSQAVSRDAKVSLHGSIVGGGSRVGSIFRRGGSIGHGSFATLRQSSAAASRKSSSGRTLTLAKAAASSPHDPADRWACSIVAMVRFCHEALVFSCSAEAMQRRRDLRAGRPDPAAFAEKEALLTQSSKAHEQQSRRAERREGTAEGGAVGTPWENRRSGSVLRSSVSRGVTVVPHRVAASLLAQTSAAGRVRGSGAAHRLAASLGLRGVYDAARR
jgi:hypothetical protein